MGDPNLELETLRELDEAGATYFALTLHDPALRQCLVSTLCFSRDPHSYCKVFAILPILGARP